MAPCPACGQEFWGFAHGASAKEGNVAVCPLCAAVLVVCSGCRELRPITRDEWQGLGPANRASVASVVDSMRRERFVRSAYSALVN